MIGLKRNKLFICALTVAISFVFFVSFYSTFSLNNDEYVFSSLVYGINDKYIENVSVNTDVALFLKYFDVGGYSVEVLDVSGKKQESGFVANGSKTVLRNKSNEIIKEYINIIDGDIDNDGDVDVDDLFKIGEVFVNNYKLEEYQVKCLDVDLDGEAKINDLLLLDKALSYGYESITLNKNEILLQSEERGRIVAKVSPSYGINQNVKWKSLNESVAIVDDAGMVTGKVEGITKIEAMTMDGEKISEAQVVVDNTIQLETYKGVGYVGGSDVKVKIKSVDYEGISCNIDNEKIANCEIVDEYLIIKPIRQGDTSIEVKSDKYGSVTYKLQVYSVYLNVMPNYLCTTPGNVHYITVSGFHSGELTFNSSDKEIISNAYMDWYGSRRMLRIEFGQKEGRATLMVREANGNTSEEVVVDISRISIPEIGKFASVGEEISTLIAGEHLGELSCKSDDEALATCRIEDNKLFVTTLGVGEVIINVYNKFSYKDEMYNCGNADFLVVIEDE